MDPALLLQGWALGLAIAATVGPITLLCVRRTLTDGRAMGLASGMGVATADATYGAIAAFGLTAVTDLLVDWRRGLAVVGGLFLLWLAWRTFRTVPREAAPGPAADAYRAGSGSRRGLASAYLTLLGLTLTNPLTIIAFGALFIGLGVTGGDAAGATILTLGVFLGSTSWWVLLVGVVGALRTRLALTWMRRINVGSGLLIGAFGIVALASAAA